MSTFYNAVFQRSKVPHSEEQRLLREFFGNRKNGVYVDVGANEPVRGSTSWDLEQRGWTGVLVEPIPALADQLREARKGQVFNCACSGPEAAGKALPLYLHPVNSGWSTLNKEASPWVDKEYEKIEVPVRTLDDILEEAGLPEGFELLAMDVEFHEVEALRELSLDRWKPQLIFVEDHAHNHKLLNYLTSHGYKFFRRTSLNSWFVPEGSPLEPSVLMKYAFFRKYYLGLPIRKFRQKLKS